MRSENRVLSEYSLIEGVVHLEQAGSRWVIDVQDRCVPQESIGHGYAASVCWGVTRANKLDSLEGNPLEFLPVPKSSMLNKLPDKGNDFLPQVSW